MFIYIPAARSRKTLRCDASACMPTCVSLCVCMCVCARTQRTLPIYFDFQYEHIKRTSQHNTQRSSRGICGTMFKRVMYVPCTCKISLARIGSSHLRCFSVWGTYAGRKWAYELGIIRTDTSIWRTVRMVDILIGYCICSKTHNGRYSLSLSCTTALL